MSESPQDAFARRIAEVAKQKSSDAEVEKAAEAKRKVRNEKQKTETGPQVRLFTSELFKYIKESISKTNGAISLDTKLQTVGTLQLKVGNHVVVVGHQDPSISIEVRNHGVAIRVFRRQEFQQLFGSQKSTIDGKVEREEIFILLLDEQGENWAWHKQKPTSANAYNRETQLGPAVTPIEVGNVFLEIVVGLAEKS